MPDDNNSADLVFRETSGMEKRHKHYLKKHWRRVLALVIKAHERGEHGAVVVDRRSTHQWMSERLLLTSPMRGMYAARADLETDQCFLCIFVDNQDCFLYPVSVAGVDHGC